MLLETLCILSLVLTTACQFNPKLTDSTGEIYGGRSQIFIHHNKQSFPQDYEVYVDQKLVDPDVLDKNGMRLSPGKHGIDIVDKKSSKKIRHFDIEINKETEKHFNLCTRESPQDFTLEDGDGSQNTCINSTLN